MDRDPGINPPRRGVSGVADSVGLLPVPSLTRRDAVMNQIRRAILLGRLRPGEKLTENRLATSLNVSRPTMREALTQLTQEGLLIQEPYRGLRVADLDPESIMDIARTRVALDMLAIKDVLADSSGRRLERVVAAWRAYDQLPFDADPLEAHEAHLAFHRGVWNASENTLLIRLWPVTEAHITIALAYDQATRDDPRRAHDVHEAIVDAVVSGDLEQVHRALVVHTIDSAETLVAMLTDAAAVAR
jgi:DNA-binding GntR family transcriptional regulator